MSFTNLGFGIMILIPILIASALYKRAHNKKVETLRAERKANFEKLRQQEAKK